MALAAALVLLLGSRDASAQPVSFQLRNDVPSGQKPALVVTTIERLAELRLDLVRADDEAAWSERHGALAAGKSVTFSVGDGKPGKAHYTGKLSATLAAGPWSFDLSFDTLVRAPMSVGYDYEHLDLARRELRFTLSRPAAQADIVALDEDGHEIGSGSATYNKERANGQANDKANEKAKAKASDKAKDGPGEWLPIQWTPKPGATGRLMVLKLHVVSTDGLGSTVELVPWTVSIEHEDVNFATDSAAIAPSEAAKLDASLKKIQEVAARAGRFVKVKLYVAGHTDTVGSAEHNRKLSLERARAIADYFRARGLQLPLSYEGFGEDLPKVPTADETDELRNRRVDYVLGAIGASPPVGDRRAEWKSLPLK